ncbi:hypothetical protein KFE25_002056 [Diacronema lutheri]|uniref:Chalcone isomerase domain-containing protein n=2 Tax=Diacronema lutheri TaxID=2081491 RepID=A0A8J5XVP0_DIALT|nr:hypothetical protein KFE25_002056 [Diacronema lutheri]
MTRSLVLAAAVLATVVSAAKDSATGIVFPDTYAGSKLAGLGTRYKGPLKIYSAAVYVSPSAAKFKLGKFKGVAPDAVKKDFFEALVSSSAAKVIVLKMAMGISKEKLASALSDSVRPRMGGGDLDAVPKFAGAILSGFQPDGKAASGTELAFGLQGSSMCITVNGKKCGTVKSAKLVDALLKCYMDDKAVSPALKRSCAQGVLSML